MSIRRACACLRIDTSLYHYKSKRGDQAALKVRIKGIAATRVRYGYRRVHVLAENLAGKALRDGELRHNMIDTTPTAGRAQ